MKRVFENPNQELKWSRAVSRHTLLTKRIKRYQLLIAELQGFGGVHFTTMNRIDNDRKELAQIEEKFPELKNRKAES